MSEYYMIVTDAGAALETAAKAGGTTVQLAQFAAGDGGGAPITPDPTATALANEVYRGDISSLLVNTDDPAVLDAQCVIPPDSGGYTVREIGLYTDDGTLYAIGNYIEQEKPDPADGLTIEMDIKVEIAVSDISTVTLVYSGQSFLTPDQADALYLRQDKQLAEIAAQGEEGQQAARDNIGAVAKDTTVNGHALSTDVVVTSQDIFGTATSINDAADLNTFTTPGIYYQTANASAAGGTNYPEPNAGSLRVYKATGDGVVQEYSIYNNSRVYRRGLYADEWSSWAQGYDTQNPPPTPDLSSYETIDDANAKFVQGVQLGAESSMAASGGSGDSQTAKVPAGNAVTGTHSNYNDSNWELDTLYFKPIQEDVNGTWKTIEG
jgi:hypothetical protein